MLSMDNFVSILTSSELAGRRALAVVLDDAKKAGWRRRFDQEGGVTSVLELLK